MVAEILGLENDLHSRDTLLYVTRLYIPEQLIKDPPDRIGHRKLQRHHNVMYA